MPRERERERERERDLPDVLTCDGFTKKRLVRHSRLLREHYTLTNHNSKAPTAHRLEVTQVAMLMPGCKELRVKSSESVFLQNVTA